MSKNKLDFKNKKTFFFDLDGTIYIDGIFVPGAVELFELLIKKNMDFVFISNNSSKTVDQYINLFKKNGINLNSQNFYTSTDLTLDFLEDSTNLKRLYLISTDSVSELFKERGFQVYSEYSEEIEAVVVTFDRELTYKKLEIASKLLFNDKKFIATNQDLVCPTSFGYIPDCGIISDILFKTTGKKPKYLGKPNPEIIINYLKKNKISKDSAVIIGDRLSTDIMTGLNAKVDTIAVLTGETSIDEISKSNIKPTAVLDSVKDIIEYIR